MIFLTLLNPNRFVLFGLGSGRLMRVRVFLTPLAKSLKSTLTRLWNQSFQVKIDFHLQSNEPSISKSNLLVPFDYQHWYQIQLLTQNAYTVEHILTSRSQLKINVLNSFPNVKGITTSIDFTFFLQLYTTKSTSQDQFELLPFKINFDWDSIISWNSQIYSYSSNFDQITFDFETINASSTWIPQHHHLSYEIINIDLRKT